METIVPKDYIIEHPIKYFSPAWAYAQFISGKQWIKLGDPPADKDEYDWYYKDADKIPWKLPDDTTDILSIGSIVATIGNIGILMDEAYRILKPNGIFLIDAPYTRNDRWYRNPNNLLPINEDFFGMFSRDWCERNGLTHISKCDFAPLAIDYIYETEWQHRAPSARNFARTHYYNVVHTIRFALGALK